MVTEQALAEMDAFVRAARAAGDPESMWIAEFVAEEAARLRSLGVN